MSARQISVISSIYKGFSSEVWDDAAPPGQRTIAVVRDYQDALAIADALAGTARAETKIANGPQGLIDFTIRGGMTLAFLEDEAVCGPWLLRQVKRAIARQAAREAGA